MHPVPSPLVIAVRVYPESTSEEKDFDRPERQWRLPKAMFIFDTETEIDHTQRLKFGTFRFLVENRCLKEGLFHAKSISPEECRILRQYAEKESAEVVDEGLAEIVPMTQSDLVKEFYRDGYKGRGLIVGFNLPFDLSRIACGFKNARKRFAGGFSLRLWSYVDKKGKTQFANRRPAIGIKHIDSKRALKGFTDRFGPDDEDRIPEGSTTGKAEDDYIFRGHFLDLRTLAFSLTDKAYTLESACEAFGVEHGKKPAKRHGIISNEYIRYNRDDVRATSELAIKLLEEYRKHPIKLQPTMAYSPASIGKSYLRAMGIRPILERQPKFPRRFLGHAQSAFYGGRTSAHIRKVPVPVVYTDFLSMYPTVNSLMGLWRFVIAREIKVLKRCQSQVERFLRRVQANPDILFEQKTWPELTAFVRIMPDGDVLPSRGRYTQASNDWQVAVNYLHADTNDSKQGLWFSLPDAVASVLLTGRLPKIVDAFRIVPKGKLKNLDRASLRSTIDVDPAKQDFFKVVIEERKNLSRRKDLSDIERDRLDKALKVLANATSYGIYAEMHRLESERKRQVTCYSIDSEPFFPWVRHPDEPGAYCFPPLASLITGAARLMLALLEHEVDKLGGTYAMEDTDSMAIVAMKNRGLVPCLGGKYRTKDGREAVRALSRSQVERISKRFAKLNPYKGEAGKGSILKIETDNRDPRTKEPRQIYCFAISAKRYALFLLDESGNPKLLRNSCPHCGRKNKTTSAACVKCDRPIEPNNEEDRWSEHGLGHLLNPSDPESEDREWIAQAWLRMIRTSLGKKMSEPAFGSLPVVGHITVSSPSVMRSLKGLNVHKSYANQIKPFNFLLSCHVRQLGYPPNVNPEKFHLIAPYTSDSREWLKTKWIDQYSGKTYRITTEGHHGSLDSARVKTYGEHLREYEVHPEAKCADARGKPCGKQTVGLLQRRHIKIDVVKFIGKESNNLEEVEAGLIHSAQNVYTEYENTKRDEWQTNIVPALREIPLGKLHAGTGLSRRALINARKGYTRPHFENRKLLASIVRKLGLL